MHLHEPSYDTPQHTSGGNGCNISESFEFPTRSTERKMPRTNFQSPRPGKDIIKNGPLIGVLINFLISCERRRALCAVGTAGRELQI